MKTSMMIILASALCLTGCATGRMGDPSGMFAGAAIGGTLGNQLKLRRIRFIDDSRTRSINAGENSKVIFEVMNEGNKATYNVVPIVEQVTKMKHIGISPSIMVEKIIPGEGIKYTATIYAGPKLRDGDVTLRIAVADENGTICDSQEFTVPAHSRK